MNKILFAIIPLIIAVTSQSQTKKYLYYFDKDMNISTASNAFFIGAGLKTENIIELKCFNNTTKSLVFLAHYSDSTLREMNGLFQSYYSNGAIESEGNYLKNKENGLWQRWDSLGNLIDSSYYENGTHTIIGSFGYYQNNTINSAVVYDRKKNKVLSEIYYNKDGTIMQEKELRNYLDTDKIFTKVEVEASFPGGEAGWNRYIKNVIEHYMDDLTYADNSGTCVIRFIVDRRGNVTNVEALSMKDTKLSEIAIKAIVKGPKWLPALQNGRPVNAYRNLPITFLMYSK